MEACCTGKMLAINKRGVSLFVVNYHNLNLIEKRKKFCVRIAFTYTTSLGTCLFQKGRERKTLI